MKPVDYIPSVPTAPAPTPTPYRAMTGPGQYATQQNGFMSDPSSSPQMRPNDKDGIPVGGVYNAPTLTGPLGSNRMNANSPQTPVPPGYNTQFGKQMDAYNAVNAQANAAQITRPGDQVTNGGITNAPSTMQYTDANGQTLTRKSAYTPDQIAASVARTTAATQALGAPTAPIAPRPIDPNSTVGQARARMDAKYNRGAPTPNANPVRMTENEARLQDQQMIAGQRINQVLNAPTPMAQNMLAGAFGLPTPAGIENQGLANKGLAQDQSQRQALFPGQIEGQTAETKLKKAHAVAFNAQELERQALAAKVDPSEIALMKMVDPSTGLPLYPQVAENVMRRLGVGQASLPKPSKPGAKIGKQEVSAYIKANGGDPNKAEQAAKADGWSF